MLSQKARYALRALITLGQKSQSTPVMIAEIAEDAHVPRKFLEQILLELKRRGIVHSHRGKFGGYTLGRPAKDITFSEVIRAVDGPLALSPCASQTAYRRCGDCHDEVTCAIRKILIKVRDATVELLDDQSLAQAIVYEQSATKTRRKRST